MSVQIDPPELDFKRPFNREVSQALHLSNPNQECIAFKVKTTAPKHYCVRPNSGRIEPGNHVDVQVLLQSMKEDPAPDAKCKDKFLVQSAFVTPDLEFESATSILEKSPKSSVQERKIRVNWLSAESGAADGGEADVLADDEPPAYTSPTAAFETPAISKKGSDETSPIPPPDFKSKKDTSPQHEPTSLKPAAALPSTEELRAQLTEANSQIKRLKDQGLRQRKPGAGESAPAAPQMMQQQHARSEAGVSLQIVAALCLLSFLLGYFFF